jgi:hypothetical protein
VAIDGADNELGPAVNAGTASLQFNDGGAGQQGWAPKLMLGLVGYFCHKELFLLTIPLLRQANRQMNLLQRLQMAVPKSTTDSYFEQDLRCQARISHIDMSSSNLAVAALVPVFHRRAFRFWKNLFATSLATFDRLR